MELKDKQTTMQGDIEYIKKDVTDIKGCVKELGDKVDEKFDHLIENMDKKYVSQDRFAPIEKIVYTLAGTALTGIVSGLIYLLIK